MNTAEIGIFKFLKSEKEKKLVKMVINEKN
jgi:hypothetical protein